LGSHFIKDAGDVVPEPSLVFDAFALAGDAEGLAWKTGSDERYSSSPRSAVEGDKVVPDRCRSQGRLFHPRHESGRCVGFPLNETHSSGSGTGEVDSELKSSDAGAEGEDGEVPGM
jgi:hypothetical protein